MEFRKYQHLERYGTTEVDGIELGECVIFPKIDGSNGSVWLSDGEVRAGSRNRELSSEKDNQGLYAYVTADQRIKDYLKKHPTHRLYGEWLVPHSLRTYRDDTWRKLYIFDVCIDTEDDGVEYMPYDVYQPLLEEFGLDYIPPIAKIKNGSYESFIRCLEQNVFLIKDGQGCGEGIVCKNYSFYNKYGRQTWAKIVTSEFKEKHAKAMGAPEIKAADMIEEKIVEDFCTSAFVEKEFSKMVNDNDGWSSKLIPQLLGRVYSELIKEESWNIVKKYKYPKIDFKTLNHFVIKKIKEVKADIFQ